MRAASGGIEINVPSLNISATTTYSTAPGAPAGFVVTEADTSVYVGRSYALSAHAVDALGNTRVDAVTIETLTPTIATFVSGQVTAHAIGRGSFALRAGGLVQTVYVSVPPAGRLVASDGSQYPRFGLVLLDTDGGSRRTFATTTGHVGFAFPGWHVDGRHVVVLESGPDTRAHIIAYDTATATRTALVDTVDFPVSLEPSYPRSGTSVYFYGARGGSERGVFRASIDGSGARLVIGDRAFGIVSPDESALLIGTSAGVVKRDLATGQEQPIASTYYAPFWSPVGNLIGYRSTNGSNTLDLHVVRPDGSGDRLVSAGIYDATSFSPDGGWIATTRGTIGVELVRVSDGLRLPVGGTRTFSQVAWRPQ
jgi:Tol biopolymer transport system component